MIRKTLCLFSLCLALCASGLCQAVSDVIVEHNVVMRARDGVSLMADVYEPAGDGSFPVLLQRTPYDKSTLAEFGKRAAKRGYLVVLQDVRGRFSSEGKWYPFKYESEDGYEAVEWAASLPHSNGKVGMFGGSYVGATQMLAAARRPPHLAGICPVATASNYHENWVYQGGAFEQWFNESWTSGLAEDTLGRTVREATNPIVESTVLPLSRYRLFNIQLDLGSNSSMETLAPYFLDWLAHPEFDSYWKQWSLEEQYASIQVPVLTVAAWYDIFQGGSLRNFIGLKRNSSRAPHPDQRLLITIGGHAGTGRTIGTVDFGTEAAVDYNDITLEWYDYLLKGARNEFATDKPVKIFVMGTNEWRYEETWPLERANPTNYYLHSAGRANSAAGDGMLTTSAAGNAAADRYIYDPADPVPTVGGPLCCDAGRLAPGPRDQQKVESREDVLVYSTPALDHNLEVTGPVELTLYAASSAVDTDFTAKLVDVWPNGFAQNLTEGILRARYRESKAIATPLVPGKIYEYQIDLWSTSNVFLKGHKIRVEISSSNFPRFDRNLNTGKAANTDADFVKATNTVYHDALHPSAIVLPVIPR